MEEGSKKAQPAAPSSPPPPDYAKGLNNFQMPKADEQTPSKSYIFFCLVAIFMM